MQIYRQVKCVHFEESSFSTLTQEGIRMVLGVITVLGWEACPLDIDMVYLEWRRRSTSNPRRHAVKPGVKSVS